MKLLIVVLFSFLIFQSIIAQDNPKSIHFGISIVPQVNFSTFEFSDLVDKKPSFCMVAGGDLYFDISPDLQFKTGLGLQYVTMRHRDYSPEFPDSIPFHDPHSDYFDFNTNYLFIGIPTELKINLSDSPNHFSLTGGANFRQKIMTSGTVTEVDKAYMEELDADHFLFEIKSTQIFATLGIAYSWHMGSNNLSAGPMIEYAPSQIFKEASSARSNGHFGFLGLRLTYQ
jgi:hypothetical protein